MLAGINQISSSKLIKVIAPLLKGIVLLVFLLLLFRAISNKDKITLIWQAYLSNLSWTRSSYLLMATLLMFLNWTLESVKWRCLLVPIVHLTPRESLRAVLVGVTTSIFTPNRIGEYLGRVMVTPKGSRWKAAFALSFGSMVQMGLIVFAGVLALWYTLISGITAVPFGTLMVFPLILSAILLMLLFFRVGPIMKMIRKRWGHHLQRVMPYFEFLESFKARDLQYIFYITLLRLLVYVVQYWLLLIFFGVNVPADVAFSLILISYLIQTGLPLPALLVLAARGEIALLVWQNMAVNELSVLSASYGLWVLNIVLPAFIGMVFILKVKTQE